MTLLMDSAVPTRAFYKVLNRLGLVTANLQFCLDAGDSGSYSGSGTSWGDLTGNGQSFNKGPTTAAPTFNGVAGHLSSNEYFSFNGSQYFDYHAANETWMQALHRSGAKWTFVFWVYIGSLSASGLAGTSGGGTTHIGFDISMLVSGKIQVRVTNGAGTALSQSTVGLLNAGAWNFVAISENEPGGAGALDFFLNGNDETGDATLTGPSASSATNVLELAAMGNAFSPIVNASRLACVAGYSINLSTAQKSSIFTATRGRFGI